MKKVLQRVSKLDKNQLLYWDESHTDINAEEINEVVGQDQNHLRWWDSWDGSETDTFDTNDVTTKWKDDFTDDTMIKIANLCVNNCTRHKEITIYVVGCYGSALNTLLLCQKIKNSFHSQQQLVHAYFIVFERDKRKCDIGIILLCQLYYKSIS